MPIVKNKHRGDVQGVSIMRPGPWGNPFQVGRDGTRGQVVQKHREWFLAQPDMVAKAKRELRGKDLVCCCAPLACHGLILLQTANEEN